MILDIGKLVLLIVDIGELVLIWYTFRLQIYFVYIDIDGKFRLLLEVWAAHIYVVIKYVITDLYICGSLIYICNFFDGKFKLISIVQLICILMLLNFKTDA